jgi:hypothetical protein
MYPFAITKVASPVCIYDHLLSYIYVCTYISLLHLWMYVFIYVYICISEVALPSGIRGLSNICICMYICTYIYIYTFLCTFVCKYIYFEVYLYTYMYRYTHMYIYVCILSGIRGLSNIFAILWSPLPFFSITWYLYTFICTYI